MQAKIRDFLRGGKGEVTIRFDDKDLARLPCDCEYDPALCGKDGNEVLVVRKIEVQSDDGSWEPYPSVTWLDGVESEEQLATKVLVQKTDEEGFNIMASTDGVPDGKLMCEAEGAGIYTETIG
ncbi:hypothetical protein KKD19_00320 [Patescibacteria group bacterium]|nr:hypothetical protein [Patescibacteria group bacterium]